MSKKIMKIGVIAGMSNTMIGGIAQVTNIKPITKTLDEIIEEEKSFKVTRFPKVTEIPNCIIDDRGERGVIPKDFYKKNKKNNRKK